MVKSGLLQRHAVLINRLMQLLDFLCILVAFFIANKFRFGEWVLTIYKKELYYKVLFVSIVTVNLVFRTWGLYSSMRGFFVINLMVRVVSAWFISMLTLITICFLFKLSWVLSRQWFFYWSFLMLFLIIMNRWIFTLILRFFRKMGWNERRAIIIGDNKAVNTVSRLVTGAAWTGINLRFIFDMNSVKKYSKEKLQVSPLPKNIIDVIKNHKIDEIWLIMPLSQEHTIRNILFQVRNIIVTVRLIPDFLDLGLLNHSVTYFAGMPTINLRESPMSGVKILIKRAEDLVLGGIFFLIALLPMLIIALLVKLDSQGSVIFKQKRYGLDGREINVYKFRMTLPRIS